jgi:hypothetical protein
VTRCRRTRQTQSDTQIRRAQRGALWAGPAAGGQGGRVAAGPEVCPRCPRRHDPFKRVGRLNTPRDLLAALGLDHGEVVLALQVEPELRVVAEMPAKAQRRFGGDPAPTVQDVGDAAGWHARSSARRFALEPRAATCARAADPGLLSEGWLHPV